MKQTCRKDSRVEHLTEGQEKTQAYYETLFAQHQNPKPFVIDGKEMFYRAGHDAISAH